MAQVLYRSYAANNCPRCGWTRYHLVAVDGSLVRSYYIQCDHCLWKGKSSHFKTLAKRSWNKVQGTFATRREN